MSQKRELHYGDMMALFNNIIPKQVNSFEKQQIHVKKKAKF